MFIIFDWDRIDAEDYEYTTKNVAVMAKACLFFTIMISCGSFIGSAVLLSNKWSAGDKLKYGLCNLISTLLIVIRYEYECVLIVLFLYQLHATFIDILCVVINCFLQWFGIFNWTEDGCCDILK